MVLGLGAALIAVWVFAASAKRYITGEDLREEMQAMQSDLSPYRHWVDRAERDRRQSESEGEIACRFPRTIDGVMVRKDRRKSNERRDLI